LQRSAARRATPAAGAVVSFAALRQHSWPWPYMPSPIATPQSRVLDRHTSLTPSPICHTAQAACFSVRTSAPSQRETAKCAARGRYLVVSAGPPPSLPRRRRVRCPAAARAGIRLLPGCHWWRDRTGCPPEYLETIPWRCEWARTAAACGAHFFRVARATKRPQSGGGIPPARPSEAAWATWSGHPRRQDQPKPLRTDRRQSHRWLTPPCSPLEPSFAPGRDLAPAPRRCKPDAVQLFWRLNGY